MADMQAINECITHLSFIRGLLDRMHVDTYQQAAKSALEALQKRIIDIAFNTQAQVSTNDNNDSGNSGNSNACNGWQDIYEAQKRDPRLSKLLAELEALQRQANNTDTSKDPSLLTRIAQKAKEVTDFMSRFSPFAKIKSDSDAVQKMRNDYIDVVTLGPVQGYLSGYDLINYLKSK